MQMNELIYKGNQLCVNDNAIVYPKINTILATLSHLYILNQRENLVAQNGKLLRDSVVPHPSSRACRRRILKKLLP